MGRRQELRGGHRGLKFKTHYPDCQARAEKRWSATRFQSNRWHFFHRTLPGFCVRTFRKDFCDESKRENPPFFDRRYFCCEVQVAAPYRIFELFPARANISWPGGGSINTALQ